MSGIIEGYAECVSNIRDPAVIAKQVKILNDRMKVYNEIPGARVGDWIREKSGRMTRATYDWNREGQTDDIIQHSGSEYGQFYLGDGYLSYSGGLDTGIRKNQLRDTGKMKNGEVWFFKDDWHTGGNGIDFMVPFRVFEVV